MLDTKLLWLATVSILAGCTTQPAKNLSASRNDVQCHTEAMTGTLVGKTVCTTQAQRDAQKADDNDLKNMVLSHAGTCTGARCPSAGN
jgi:hypothetical protein